MSFSGRVVPLFLLAVTLSACAAQDGPTDEPRLVDERLLAALGLAQGYQHQADELEALGEREEALTKVRLVLEIPFPQGAPEGEDVRLDAWGRIAELQIALNDLEAAGETVGRGLRESSRISYFQARLHAVRGRILRARAERLREEGRDDEGRQLSREAIGAFERSIAINRQVLGMASDTDADGGSE